MFTPRSLRHPSKTFKKPQQRLLANLLQTKLLRLSDLTHKIISTNQWIRLRRKKFKPVWMCVLKSENKICWSFYIFFDLVVISVVTTLHVYCSIVGFIEILYFQKCLVKQNFTDSSNLNKSSFANLNLKKLWSKTYGTFVPVFDTFNPLRHPNFSNIQQKLAKWIFGEIIDVTFETLFWKITYQDEFLVFNILSFYFCLKKVFLCTLSTWCCFLSASQHSNNRTLRTLFSKSYVFISLII